MKKNNEICTTISEIQFDENIPGICGPITFFNLINIKPSVQEIKNLIEIGAIKGSAASIFSSFLVWAEEYSQNLKFFVSSKEIPEAIFKMIFTFENIDLSKQENFRKKALEKHKNILNAYNDKVEILNSKPLEFIDLLLNNGYRVAFSIALKIPKLKVWVTHYRVCYGTKKDNYLIKDPGFSDFPVGFLEVSKKEMMEGFSNLQKMGVNYEIITYKK